MGSGRAGKLVSFGELSSGAFATAVKRLAGFRFHAHQMRRTFACVWLERGGSLAALQAVLGHSTIVTTQRYARLSDEHVGAQAERIGGRSVAPRFASDSQECRKIAEARSLEGWPSSVPKSVEKGRGVPSDVIALEIGCTGCPYSPDLQVA